MLAKWFVACYGIMAVMAFRASVKVGRHDSDYDWDEEDNYDMATLALVSFVVAAIWPVTIIAALFVRLVKRMYKNA